MRISVPVVALTWLGCQATSPAGTAADPTAGQTLEPSAHAAPAAASGAVLEKASAGEWNDLMPAANLAGFRRVPLDPLSDKPVWQVRADGTLFIDGVGAKEMLLHETELADGVLHVEWRFLAGAGDKPVYNGGVYVRTPLDGKNWVQLQVSHADKPPVVGDLIAQVPGNAERINVFQARPSPAAPLGEWNTFEVSAHGRNIELVVNGQPTVAWSDCPMGKGHVGLQAEGSPIEVRALKFKPL
jgi:hypothetical protein